MMYNLHIGNSGPLDESYVKEINDRDLVVSSILSGNRNFEGRIHPEIKMNFSKPNARCGVFACRKN